MENNEPQTETSFSNGPKYTTGAELVQAFPGVSTNDDDPDRIFGHAKELCVNKMGYTMVPPPDGMVMKYEGRLPDEIFDEFPIFREGLGKKKFKELFLQHRLHTICYCAVFWSFGMCVAFLGPTMLDLGCRTSTLLSKMSWVFFSQSLFTLLGSACGGFLIQKIGNHFVLLFSTAMLSITLGIIPSCHMLWMLAAVMAVMGFFMGTIDTVANISMIQLYGRNVAPFLQALYAFYGLGAFLSPMIAEPFLLNKDCTDLILNATENLHEISFEGNLTQPIEEIQKRSVIQYAFWIMSGLQVPVVILLVVLVVRESLGVFEPNSEEVDAGKESYELQQKSEEPHSSGTAIGPKQVAPDGKTEDDRPPTTEEQMILVVVCTAAILFLYDGIQAGYGAYIFTYAKKSIHNMSSNEAAYINACYWGTFAFGRLVSIGISTKLSPNFMLLCNISGCLISMILMTIFRHDHVVLYVGTCIFGTFLSSVYPTAVTLAETYISVTSTITSFLVVCAASGEMLMPVIIGHEFDALGPISLLVTGLITTILSCIVYIMLFFVSQTIARQTSERNFMQRLKNLIRPAPGAEINEDSGLLKEHVKYYTRMKTELSESSLAECDAHTPYTQGNSNTNPPPAYL